MDVHGLATAVSGGAGRQVGPVAPRAHPPVRGGVRPGEPAGAQLHEGDRVGLDDVRRGAAGVPRALHALHGGVRRDACLDVTARRRLREPLGQRLDDQPERAAVRRHRLRPVEAGEHQRQQVVDVGVEALGSEAEERLLRRDRLAQRGSGVPAGACRHPTTLRPAPVRRSTGATGPEALACVTAITQEALVKELVWHRQYLPLVEREAARTFTVEAATGRVSTYGESAARVLRLASGLRTVLGVSPGDRVAVMSLNSTAFLELYHAGLLGAAVVNPLNLRFAPRELAHVLADSGTEVVFVDAAFAGVIAGVREQAGVRTVVLLGDGPDGTPHDLRYDDLLAAGEEVVPPEPEEDDPALLMYTGGTTGLPKGVVLTHRSIMLTGYHMALSFELTDEPYLAQVPMFHAASMGAVIGGPFTRGGSLVIVPFFEPEAVMSACETYACSNTIMVPTMLAMTFAHPPTARSACARCSA